MIRAASARPFARPAKGSAHLLDDVREANRIEPDVRIRVARFVADAGAERLTLQHVDRLAAGVAHRVGDRGLEVVGQIEDELGALDLADLFRGQLDVVGLRTRRRQVVHVHGRAADLLGRPCDRIEGGDDRTAARRGARTAARHGGRKAHCENDSH